MTGVLITFSFASMGLLLWSFIQGFMIPPVAIRTHIVISLLATAFCIFSHSLSMMYMAAVGRMIREAVQKASLDPGPVVQSKEYRSKIFRIGTLAMVVVMSATILAGGSHTKMFPGWTHDVFAIAALLVNAFAVYIEVRCLIAAHLLGHRVAAAFQKASPADSQTT